MRILHLSPEASLGGTERALVDLLCGLKAHFPESECRHLALGEGPLLQELRERGLESSALPMPRALAGVGQATLRDLLKPWRWPTLIFLGARILFSLLPYLRRLKRELHHFDPDIIHSHGIKTHLLLRLCAPGKAIVVWHCHEYLNRPLLSFALRWAGKRARLAIANSHHTAADVAAVFDPQKVKCVYYGMDLNAFSPKKGDPSSLDRMTGFPREEKSLVRVGLVGTYAHWKGHFLFLDAIAALKRRSEGLPARFYIVGGPIYRTQESQISLDDLKAKVISLGLQDRVGLAPFQKNIAEVFQALDIVVHASTKAEPFGRTIIEAMACGKTVVVAADGGAREVFENGKSGLGVPPRNPEALAEALESLIENATRREVLSKKARAHVLSHFQRERFAREVMTFYEGLRDPLKIIPNRKKSLVVAMGYLEDNWHSSRQLTQCLADTLTEMEGRHGTNITTYFHSPSCYHSPGWVDRRIRFSRSLPPGDIFHLGDQSYGDAILEAKRRYASTVALIYDIAFWKDRNAWNYPIRHRIKHGLRLADRRIAGSQATAWELEKDLGLSVHGVIPPGVSPDIFVHNDETREPGLILHVGSVSHRKGFDRAIRFLSALPPEFRLLHLGEPLTTDQLSLIELFGVESRVEDRSYPGLPGLIDWYHRASVVILPSRYEGYGLPAIEARLCGTSVVLSHQIPAYEQMHGDSGTLRLPFELFDSRKDQEWEEAIRSFLTFPKTPVRFSNRDFFRWERVARDFCLVYDGLLGIDDRSAKPDPLLKKAS